jgi:hypothetical protein
MPDLKQEKQEKPSDPKTATNLKTHYCSETVGTCQCESKVRRGTCPSKFKEISEIHKVDRGRNTCYGQA